MTIPTSNLIKKSLLLTTGVVTTAIDGIMSIGLLAMMFIYSPILTLIVLVVSLAYLLIRLLAYPKYKQLNAETLVVSAKESTNFMGSIRGIQSIKLFAHEMQRLTLWQNYYANSVNAGLRVIVKSHNYYYKAHRRRQYAEYGKTV